MPRHARQGSESGIYHVILRGINQQVIFEDEEDYEKLLEALERYRGISEYRLYAYCLMSNHFHLLIKVEKEDLSLVIKRIAGSYVYWYNRKYKRTGHLFQDRYKSESVEKDGYLLAVLRYIHMNPVKAGLCKNPSEYKYSSYASYVNGKSGLLDLDFLFSILSKGEFEAFHSKENNDNCIEHEKKEYPLSDIEATELIKEISLCKDLHEVRSLDREKLSTMLKELKKSGLSIRQISRLTGITKGIVEKI